DEDAGLVDRRDHRQVVLLAERIVLLTGAWRDVDDPGTFLGPDVAPGNHAMLDAVLGRKLVERPAVALADQLRALHFADDLVLTPDRVLHRVPGDVVRLAVLAHEDVADFRIDGGRNVAGERPWRRRPDHEGGVFIDQRVLDEEREMRALLVTLGDDLVLGEAGAAARAPGHDVIALVDPAAFVADLQEMPDGVVDLIRHRDVAIVPVHEVREALGLLDDACGVGAHPFLAALAELRDAEFLDLALVLDPELFLDLDLHPQALGVEAVLETLFLAQHVVVALEHVLVRPAPGMVYAHGVVRGDRAIDEREGLARTVVAVQVLLDDLFLVPPVEEVAFHLREIDLGWDVVECLDCGFGHGCSLGYGVRTVGFRMGINKKRPPCN